MKKSTKIVTLSMAVLFIAATCLWLLNNGGINREGGGAIITFTDGGEVISEVDFDYLGGLESDTFEAVIRSSGNKPEDALYTGVLLTELLNDQGIDIEGKSSVIVKGLDGYMTKLTLPELEKKEVYLTYKMNGKPLKPRDDGGYGPFQLVIPGDPFSQRWCKYVCEVEIK